MPAPSDHIKALIAAYAEEAGYAVEIGSVPDIAGQDQVITIRDTGGFEPNPRYLLDFPTVQIWIRGKNGTYNATFAVAKEIKDLTVGVDAYEREDDRIDGINMLSDIAYLGMDQNKRPEFTLNLQLNFEPAPGDNTQREEL